MQSFVTSHQQGFYITSVYGGGKASWEMMHSAPAAHRNTKNKKNQTGSFSIQYKMKTDVIMDNAVMGKYLLEIRRRPHTPTSQIRRTPKAFPTVRPSSGAQTPAMGKLFIKGTFIDPSWVHLSIHAQNRLRSPLKVSWNRRRRHVDRPVGPNLSTRMSKNMSESIGDDWWQR